MCSRAVGRHRELDLYAGLERVVVSLLLSLGTAPHVVQAIARHADVDVTMKIGAHTNMDAMRQALDVIDWKAS